MKEVEEELARLRTRIDSNTFEAAVAEAQAWTMERAIAYALQGAA